MPCDTCQGLALEDLLPLPSDTKAHLQAVTLHSALPHVGPTVFADEAHKTEAEDLSQAGLMVQGVLAQRDQWLQAGDNEEHLVLFAPVVDERAELVPGMELLAQSQVPHGDCDKTSSRSCYHKKGEEGENEIVRTFKTNKQINFLRQRLTDQPHHLRVSLP